MQAIDDYIHFYNHHRYQKRLNGLIPLAFRVQAAKWLNSMRYTWHKIIITALIAMIED
ncbi:MULTISPECIES: IS3 family transposase [Lysinibacillus]|uniref:IS3 family transposase n=1 Tax=Lysinibacillus TaxID=400634 RepID=UPI0009F4EA41